MMLVFKDTDIVISSDFHMLGQCAPKMGERTALHEQVFLGRNPISRGVLVPSPGDSLDEPQPKGLNSSLIIGNN